MMSPRTIIVSLSGPSSSGKTTLARLLRTIINLPPPRDSAPSPLNISSFILHEDDFYFTDIDIPVDPSTGLQDWDCLEAIDVPALVSALGHIKAYGRPPDDLVSKEDQNEVGESGISEIAVEKIGGVLRTKLYDIVKRSGVESLRVAIVDGFLLYADPNSGSPLLEAMTLLDVKLSLRTTYSMMKERRERRSGYVTLEGFWEDPPGYVDKIVWPNYVNDHAWMFERGDVNDGEVREVVRSSGIEMAPGKGEVDMEGLLKWAGETLENELARLLE